MLGLDPQELLLYGLPNLESFLSHEESSSDKESAWTRFLSNQSVRDTYQITEAEFEALSRLSMMGDVRSLKDFVFVLKTLRRMSRN